MSAVRAASPGPGEPLLRPGLRPPGRPRHFVPRPRLLALLDDLAEYPVVAVVAPAGTGKTVLAADWLAHSPGPSAWLTLDPADRGGDGVRSALLGALDALAGSTTAGSGTGPRPAAGVRRRPPTLVIDDADRVTDDEAARALLSELVEHRPDWLHVLLLSRRRPPLGVDRLRASGELADVDVAALRFTEEEATLLLDLLCPDLPVEQRTAAVGWADGWAAALQLTGLAVRSGRSTTAPSAAGPAYAATADAAGGPVGRRLVDEYLWDEALAPARPELVTMLLAAAVAGRIDAGLAESLTERPDAADLLDEAHAAGLFLTAWPDGWFEVHSLVRELLTARLRHRWPDGLRKQHARAAQWFEGRGDASVALDHWLAAERPSDALRVLAGLSLPLLDAGHAARAADAVARIPAATVLRDPSDGLRYAWCQLPAGARPFREALSVLDPLGPALPEGDRGRLDVLRAASDWLRADWALAAARARGALDGSVGTAGPDPIDRFGRRVVAGAAAVGEEWDDASPAIGQARVASLADPASRWAFEGIRAVGLALAGHPLVAARVADDARATAPPTTHRTLHFGLALADAVVARELDHRDDARALLEELAGTAAHPDPVLQLVAGLELTRLALSGGDLDAAAARLDDTDRLCARLDATAGGSTDGTAAASASSAYGLVARVGVDLALAADDPATAERWAVEVSDGFWGPASEAKVQLALGRHDDAEEAVRRARPRCPRHDVTAALLRARALAPRDRGAAARVVGDTLDVAARHGLLRTVASDGAPLAELVELAAWRVPDAWMTRLRHALVPTWSGHDARHPVEDLTEREREVLRLLPSRLTLAEVSAELYVSPNTLKFHLRAIYRKLGVESRAQAVDAARRMRLLPS